MVVEKGFRQTDVGIIPDDWEVKELGNTISKIGSGITPTGGAKVYKKEGRPFLRSQNIGWGKLILNDIEFIDELTHQTFPNSEIKYLDVLLNITGASIGRTSIATKEIVGGNVNQHVCIIRTDFRQIYPPFLNYFLLSQIGQKQIDSFQSGGNRQGLNIGQIKTFQIPSPPLHEQTAIASALSDMDQLIAKTEQLIEKKKAIKHGVMQELLRPKEGWVKKRLGDFGKTYGGITGKSKSDFGCGNAHFIPFMNIMSNPVIDIEFLQRVNIKPGEIQNKVQKGDLFFNGSSETPEEVGLCSLLDSSIEGLYLNSFCFGYRTFKQNELNGHFIAYYFRSPLGRNLIFSLAQGATRYNLSKTNLLKLELPIPSFREQETIASLLIEIDEDLRLQKLKLQKLKLQKQGMMQALLTGKIRLV